MLDSLELKRARTEKFAKVGLFIAVAVGGFMISPFILSAIKGVVGAGVLLVLMLVAINLAPWLSKKLANVRLKMLKAEAAKNPIETLENQYAEKMAALAAFRQSIKEFHGAVLSFKTTILEYKEKHEGPTPYDEQYGKMVLLLKNREKKYIQVQQRLQEFALLIDRKRDEWKLAQIAIRTNKAAGVGEDFISKLMKDEAVSAVTDGLNTAFSELQVSLLDEQAENADPVVQTKNVTPTPASKALPSANDKLSLDLDFINQEEIESTSKS
jgi:hypothetical protein